MELNIHAPLPRRKDFRIGILGSGFIVNDCHLVAYRKAGFNPVAIASRNREHAKSVAQRHKIPKVYENYDELLDDPTIEVLDIAVTTDRQLDLIQAACARKTVKGILAQKPLGMNYAEAVEAVAACEKAGITLAVNQNMRYDHSVRAAKTLLENGIIGEPVFATIEMRGIPHWKDWHEKLGWLTLRIMSIHHLDTFRYWFGDPEGIYCSVRPDPRTKFAHTDGICTYILEYGKGLRCVGIDDTWTGPAKEGCPGDIYIKWRIEGLNGLAIGDIGWCKDPYTTPSTIRYASKGDKHFQSPVWPESWFPDAFIGTMAQLLIRHKRSGQSQDNGAGGGGVFERPPISTGRGLRDRKNGLEALPASYRKFRGDLGRTVRETNVFGTSPRRSAGSFGQSHTPSAAIARIGSRGGRSVEPQFCRHRTRFAGLD